MTRVGRLGRAWCAPSLVQAACLFLTGCLVPAGCAATSEPTTSTPSSRTVQSASSATPECARIAVALDPGHNPVVVDGFDPVTGASMRDYPNGAEDGDVFAVAMRVRRELEGSRYRVVLLKTSVGESVTYRERVDRAAAAGARLGISIHTSPGVNAVFEQRVDLYRAGPDATGATQRVTFTNAATAAASHRYATAIASSRSVSQRVPVVVTDNDFGGRAPLWSGNIPVIALISDAVPWVYNEAGTATAGGSTALPPAFLTAYADGVRSALPVDAHGCATR